MGFRFRKTIKLGPGLKLNLSKSGVSTTVGGRGNSITVGKTGVTQNLGIPGTGISFRKKIASFGSNKEKNPGSTQTVRPIIDPFANQQPAPAQAGAVSPNSQAGVYGAVPITYFTMQISDEGELTFYDDYGNPIFDPSVIAQIKRSPRYAEFYPVMMESHRAEVAEKVAQLNSATGAYRKLHVRSPQVLPRFRFEEYLAGLSPQMYTPVPYQEPAPTPDQVTNLLSREANENVRGMPWKIKQLKADYINSHFEERFAAETNAWLARRQAHDAAENSRAQSINASYQAEYNQKLAAIQNALAGNAEYIEEASEQVIGSLDIPVETSFQFEYRAAEHCLMVDLDLPEIEDLPTEKAAQTAAGHLTTVDKTQKELRQEYSECVFGLAVYLAANLFDISPDIMMVVVSGCTQRRDSMGNLVDNYIYSIKYTREAFYGVDYSVIDPEGFSMRFENRCKMTATKVMNTITPYE